MKFNISNKYLPFYPKPILLHKNFHLYINIYPVHVLNPIIPILHIFLLKEKHNILLHGKHHFPILQSKHLHYYKSIYHYLTFNLKIIKFKNFYIIS